MRTQNQREHSGLGQIPKHTHIHEELNSILKKYFLFKKKRKEKNFIELWHIEKSIYPTPTMALTISLKHLDARTRLKIVLALV